MITNKDIEKLKETFATKEEMKNSAEEVKRHFDVVAEDIKSEFRIVAEQLSSNSDKLNDHDQRINNLDEEVSMLGIRMTVVEGKVR